VSWQQEICPRSDSDLHSVSIDSTVCDDGSEFVLYPYVLLHALIQAVEMTVALGWLVWDCRA